MHVQPFQPRTPKSAALRPVILAISLTAAATLGGAACVARAAESPDAAKPFLGSWALTIPGGAAGWLGLDGKRRPAQGRTCFGAAAACCP